MRNLKKVVSVFTIIASMTALCSCAGGTDESDSKVDKNKLVVGVQQDVDSLDPYLAQAAGTKEILFNIFEGLMKPDENGNMIPALATEYTISDDCKTYQFKLRQNVVFHNGKTMTAQDVKYSIENYAGLLDGTKALEKALDNISGVEIIDEQTIEIKLTDADTELLPFLTEAIVPCDYSEQSKKPVGTGPYKFESYSAALQIVLKRNDSYWGAKASIEQVTFKIITTVNTAVLDLKSGSIDVYPYMTADQANEAGSNFNVLEGTSNMVQALFLNNKVKPFDNILVRQALNYALDKDEIMDFVADKKGAIIGSAMFPAFGKYYNKDTETYYSYNIEKAKELLEEAGYKDGFEFTLKVPVSYEFHVQTALVIKDQLNKIGITVNIESIDWNTWLLDVYTNRNYEATVIAIDSGLAPKEMLSRYVSDAQNNFVNFGDAQYDALFAETIASTNDETKVENYKKLQEIITKQAASVFIQAPALLVAVNKNVNGYKFYPVYVQDIAALSY